jgi:hypothetical protein
MTLMPETRTWEKQGVTIEYLCFPTLFSHTISKTMRDKYSYPAPTANDPETTEVSTPVYIFYTAMPLIVSVSLVDDAPHWGQLLKAAVEDSNWLSDPVADYVRLERRAPDNLLIDCYEGYKLTREKAYGAALELQTPPPAEPQPDPETGEVSEDALNFTMSSASDGGPSSPVKVLNGRAKRSDGLPQTAKLRTSPTG